LLPWSGAILSAPCVAIDPKVASPFLKYLAGLLSRFVPKFGVTQLDPTFLSKIPSVVHRQRRDKLVFHGETKARFAAEMLKSIEVVQNNAKSISIPVLIVHGDDDRIIPIQGSRDIMSKISSKDKQMVEFKGGYHELFNDLDSAKCLDVVHSWLHARCDRMLHST
jgi:alpha-beta hydrolase superfamily lysophospholipase